MDCSDPGKCPLARLGVSLLLRLIHSSWLPYPQVRHGDSISQKICGGHDLASLIRLFRTTRQSFAAASAFSTTSRRETCLALASTPRAMCHGRSQLLSQEVTPRYHSSILPPG